MADWFDATGNGSLADAVALMGDANDAMAELVRLGALVSAGLTGDGGAMGITVTLDGRWRREYFRDAESMLTWLAEALDAVKNADRPTDAPSGSRTRSRGTRGR